MQHQIAGFVFLVAKIDIDDFVQDALGVVDVQQTGLIDVELEVLTFLLVIVGK